MAAVIPVQFKIGGEDVIVRSFRTIATSARKAERERISSAQRGTAAVVASTKASADAATGAARSVVAAERQTTRAIINEHRAREASVKKLAKAAEEATAKVSRVGAGIGRTAPGRVAAGSSVRDGAMQGARSAVGVAGAVTGLVGGALGTAGIINGVQKAVAVDRGLTLLANDTSEGKNRIDERAYRDRIQKLSEGTGIDQLDILASLDTAAGEGGGRGGLEAFAQNLEQIGQLSLASGTKLEDLAKISAALTNVQVTGADEQMEIMRNVYAASKTGNVNMREMAAGVSQVMGAFNALGYSMPAKQAALDASGLIQIAKGGGAKNAEDATTAARNLANDMATHEMSLRKLGVKTVSSDGKTRVGISDQFNQLMKITGGDLRKINRFGQIFGAQSQSAAGAFSRAFRGENTDLKDSKGKVLKGAAAVDALIAKFSGATMSQAEVDEGASRVKGSTSAKYEMAMRAFENAMANELLPAVTKAAPEFAKLAQAVASMTKFAVEYPALAAGGFIALNAALGGAQAAIGNWVSGVVSGTGAVNSHAGALTKGIAAVAAFSAGFSVGTAIAEELDKPGAEKNKREKAERAKTADDLIGRLTGGAATAEDLDQARSLQQESERRAGMSGWDRFKEEANKIVSDRMTKIQEDGLSLSTIGNLMNLMGPDALRAGYTAAGNATDAADAQILADAIATALRGVERGEATRGVVGPGADAIAQQLQGELKVRVVNADEVGGARPPGSPIAFAGP